MNNIIEDKDWKPTDNIIYNENSVEMEVIKCNKNCLVSAGPGAGKTELLAQKSSYLLQTNKCKYPKKILALSFKVDAKDNIKERIQSRYDKDLSNRFVSSTYDSFFKSILDRFYHLLPDDYRPATGYNILSYKALIDTYAMCGMSFKGLTSNERDFFVRTYLVETSLPFDRAGYYINDSGYYVNDPNYNSLAIDVWGILLKGNKDIAPQISFPMIARLVEYLIKENPIIKNLLELTYSHVFLDEFQDTTISQYAAIKACFKDTNTIITAVGDKKQRIMGWAGAVENLFDKFKDEFNADEKTLLINHRSSPKLICIQKEIVKEIIKTDIEISIDEKWDKNSGEAEILYFKNEYDEAKILSKKIYSLININNININDICILTRMKSTDYCDKLIGNMKSLNIESRIEEVYQDVLKEDLIKVILDIIKLAINQMSPNERIEIMNILKKINGYGIYTNINRINILENDLSKYINEIRIKIIKIENEKDLLDVINNIISYLGRENLKILGPQYKEEDYINNIIDKFVSLLWNDYKINLEWNYALDRFNGKFTIPIMSIHKSKGLEFNTIILLGLEGSAFWAIDKNFDEELCNFFVAVSRAKERLIITYSNEREIERKKIVGQKQKVELFYDLINNSNVVESHDFREEFEEIAIKYFNKVEDLVAATIEDCECED